MPVGLSHMFNDETWFCVGLVGKLHVAPFGRKLIYIYIFSANVSVFTIAFEKPQQF